MKLTNSCAWLALGLSFLTGIVGCKPDTMPNLPCDSTTLVLHRKSIKSTSNGLKITDTPDRPSTDTLKFPGAYTINWGEGMFAESRIFVRVAVNGRKDSVAPIQLISSLWDLGKALPPEAAPIKRCYDTIKAHFPDAH